MISREFCPDLGHLKYKKSVLEPKTLVSTWFVNLANKAKRVFSFESASQKWKKKKESNDCKGNTFCAHKKLSDNAP